MTTPPVRDRLLEAVIEVPAVAVTFLMMAHITANALLRTFWNSPIHNTLEYVQYWYMPVIACLGFISAQHRGQHIAADMLFERLPKRAQPLVLGVLLATCAAVCAGFAWFGWNEAVDAYEIKKVAGVSTVPAWPAYFLVPVTFATLTVQFALGAVRALKHPESEHFITDPDDALLLEQFAADERKAHS